MRVGITSFFLRKLEKNSHLLYGQVDIPFDLLTQGSIEYKYCLHKKDQRVYEYVIRHGKHGPLINRILNIPKEERIRVRGKRFVDYHNIR